MKAKKLSAITLLAFLSGSGVQDSQPVPSEPASVFRQNDHFASDAQLFWQYALSPGVPLQIAIPPSSRVSIPEDKNIETLLNIKNSAQEPLFATSDEAATYLAYNGTLDDAHVYAEVTLMLGSPVGRTMRGGLSSFIAENGRMEEALGLLTVTVPANGKEDSVFQTWEDLALYKFVGGTKEYAAQLASFRNKDDSAPFSSAQDYIYAAYVKADIKTVTALHELKNNDDVEIFATAQDMLAVCSNYTNESKRITNEKIAQLRKIKTLSGKFLFATVDDFFSAAGIDVSYNELQNLASIPADTGDSLFAVGADAVQYAVTKKGDQYLQKLRAIENNEGTHIFTDGAYVAAYAAMDGKPEAAQQLADWIDGKNNPSLLPYEVIRYAALGFTQEDLTAADTEKPNALGFIGISDYNHAFLDLIVKGHLKKLRDTYDFHLEFIQKDTAPEQKYTTLKDYSLLLLGGHGDGELRRIRLGEGAEESAYLDETDEEFCKLLDTLPSDAHVFVFSCYAGIGGEVGNNFANYVAACAPGRTVISSMTPMAAGNITIETAYPFTAQINTAERYPYNMDLRQKKEQRINATYIVTKPKTTFVSDSAQAPAALH